MTTKNLVVAFVAAAAAASTSAHPSRQTVLSCLAGYSTSPSIKVLELRATEIDTEQEYSGGYDATFLIKTSIGVVGYAAKAEMAALIHGRKLYPLQTALPLLHSVHRPDDFNPFLAEWSKVQHSAHRYLCVSFPVGALGASGEHQNIRGGFMLSLANKRLYYAVANIAKSD